jgi:hypothetical protein
MNVSNFARWGLSGLALVFAAGLTACGSTGSSYCDRLEECNLLQGSKDECSENVDNQLDNLSSAARSDCEDAINECLDLSSCGNFSACVGRLPC